ncbi:MAG: hypothetical protein KJ593_03950 [Candidatus Omnitrophica bacterium]|nr:hypothetical protein [Candidatus Omnitrophota bacterium]
MSARTQFLRLNDNRGIALITTYLLVAVLFVLGAAFFLRTTSERIITDVDRDNLIAFNAGEAGLARAIVYMRNRTGGSDTSNNDPFDPFSSPVEKGLNQADVLNNIEQVFESSVTFQQFCAEPDLDDCASTDTAGGTYQAIIDPDQSNFSGSVKNRFIITVRGIVGGISRTLIAAVQIDNFARFAYFSDDEHYGRGRDRAPVWFITGDEIWGPTHTNGHFHILGNPIFHDAVVSVDDFITYFTPAPSAGNDPQFLGGLTLGIDPIPMPHQAIELHTASVQGGEVFNGNTTIVLNADGTMDVTNGQLLQTEGCSPCNRSLPANYALYVSGGDLTLSGTLDGSLTVGTNRDIIIADDIRYNCEDPLIACPGDPNELCVDAALRDACDDMLGIIAEKEVIVSDSIAHNHIRIDGSIMAMDQSFTVENYNTGDPRGILTVFGGIIQDQRGPVGTGSVNMVNGEAEITHGYAKNYIYDSRFATNPPMYFPRTGDYLNLVWQEELGL